jgi:drug/metabolite transporter (DMT)-like permease
MIILVVLLYALFGFSFTLGKLMLFHAAPFFVIGTRMLVGGIFLLTYVYHRYKISCYPKREDWWLYAQTTIFGIYIFYSVRAWGLQYVTTTKAALLCNLLPFFTALFSYLHLKERLTIYHLVGLIFGFLGMVPILMHDSSFEELIGGISFVSWPELAIMASVAALGYSVIITQKLVKHRGCPPALVNGFSMLVGGAMAFTSSVMVEDKWIRGSWRELLVLIIAQIIVSNLICANLHASLLKQYSATFMSFASFLSPLFTIIYGYFLLGETVSWQFFLSFFMVLLALLIYHTREIKAYFAHRKIKDTTPQDSDMYQA